MPFLPTLAYSIIAQNQIGYIITSNILNLEMCGLNKTFNKQKTEDKYLFNEHTNECINDSNSDQQNENNTDFLLII